MLGILVEVEDGNAISSSGSDTDISLMFKCSASPPLPVKLCSQSNNAHIDTYINPMAFSGLMMCGRTCI